MPGICRCFCDYIAKIRHNCAILMSIGLFFLQVKEKIVNLQVVRKGKIIGGAAFVLMLWYCFSVIGFDVHSCAHTGKSYVSTFLQGYTCSDIHPEHHCDESCCHASDRHKTHSCELVCALLVDETAGHCCVNSIKVLSLTGMPDDDEHHHYDECHCGHCPCIAEAVKPVLFGDSYVLINYIHDAVPLVRDVLSIFSVLII